MAKKLERVPVKITVTLEFDRPEFPMPATKLATAKRISLERYYVQAIQAMVAMQSVDEAAGPRYSKLLEQISDFNVRP